MFGDFDHNTDYNLMRKTIKNCHASTRPFLMKLMKNWDNLAKEMFLEQVVCRRKKAITPRYAKLHEDYIRNKQIIEEYLVIVALSF